MSEPTDEDVENMVMVAGVELDECTAPLMRAMKKAFRLGYTRAKMHESTTSVSEETSTPSKGSRGGSGSPEPDAEPDKGATVSPPNLPRPSEDCPSCTSNDPNRADHNYGKQCTYNPLDLGPRSSEALPGEAESMRERLLTTLGVNRGLKRLAERMGLLKMFEHDPVGFVGCLETTDLSWAFPHRRADGWPLCPQCGDDELFSSSIPATEATIAGCYACNWKPDPRTNEAKTSPLTFKVGDRIFTKRLSGTVFGRVVGEHGKWPMIRWEHEEDDSCVAPWMLELIPPEPRTDKAQSEEMISASQWEEARLEIIEQCAQEAERSLIEYSEIDLLDTTPERLRIARRIRFLKGPRSETAQVKETGDGT